mmetsp:Transcript_33605/g.95637  ORF Transcript_33605/g.95637 Transcript_33605/m.95637 type:complete len:317 (-) Transcript_33605:984-1934(-)
MRDSVDQLLHIDLAAAIGVECVKELELVVVAHIQVAEDLPESALHTELLERRRCQFQLLPLLDDLCRRHVPPGAPVGHRALDLQDEPNKLEDLSRIERLVAQLLPADHADARFRANHHVLDEYRRDDIEQAEGYEEDQGGIEGAVAPPVAIGDLHEDRPAVWLRALLCDCAPEEREEREAQGAESLSAMSQDALVAQGLAENEGEDVQRDGQQEDREEQRAHAPERAGDEDRQLFEQGQTADTRDPGDPQKAQNLEHGQCRGPVVVLGRRKWRHDVDAHLHDCQADQHQLERMPEVFDAEKVVAKADARALHDDLA